MMHIQNILTPLSECPPVRWVLDALGMKVALFYLFLEKRAFVDLSHMDAGFSEYETALLGPEDMHAVAAMGKRDLPEAAFHARLQRGDICYGMKHMGALVAFTWAKTKQYESFLWGLRLKSDEAYLFDTVTRKSYRGRGIAPYIRWRMYGELEKWGKVDLYSYSLGSNAPALRFKAKLNGRMIGLRLYIRLLDRFHFTVPLKKYRVSLFQIR